MTKDTLNKPGNHKLAVRVFLMVIIALLYVIMMIGFSLGQQLEQITQEVRTVQGIMIHGPMQLPTGEPLPRNEYASKDIRF